MAVEYVRVSCGLLLRLLLGFLLALFATKFCSAVYNSADDGDGIVQWQY